MLFYPDRNVPEWFDVLELGARAENALRSSGVTSLQEALHKNELFWLRIPKCGRKTVDEILAALRTPHYHDNTYDAEWW